MSKKSKQTDNFKKIIKKELDLRAFKDPLFEKKYNNPDKNIDDCCTYILATVQKSGINGFTNDEVFSMAIHYYSEKEIDLTGYNIGNVNIVVNQEIKLTEEEIEEARQEARDKVIEEEMTKMRSKNKKTSQVKPKAKDSKEPNTLF